MLCEHFVSVWTILCTRNIKFNSFVHPDVVVRPPPPHRPYCLCPDSQIRVLLTIVLASSTATAACPRRPQASAATNAGTAINIRIGEDWSLEVNRVHPAQS